MLYLLLLLVAITTLSFLFTRFLIPEILLDSESAGASDLKNNNKKVLVSSIDLDLINFNKDTDKIIFSEGSSLEKATKPILNGKYIVCRQVKNIDELKNSDNIVIQRPKGFKLREFQSADGDILNTCHYKNDLQEFNKHQFKDVVGKIIYGFDKTLKEAA